ncbi:hypothetical protein [Xanthomonas sp. 60]
MSNAAPGTCLGRVQAQARAFENLNRQPQAQRMLTTRPAQIISKRDGAHLIPSRSPLRPGSRPAMQSAAAEAFNTEACCLRFQPEHERKAVFLTLLCELQALDAEHRVNGFDTLLCVLSMVPEADRSGLMPRLQQFAEKLPLPRSRAALSSLAESASLHPAMSVFTTRVRAYHFLLSTQWLEAAPPEDRPARLGRLVDLLAQQPEPARAAALTSLLEASERGPTPESDLPVLLDALYYVPESDRTPLVDALRQRADEQGTAIGKNWSSFASWLNALPSDDRAARFTARLDRAVQLAGAERARCLSDLSDSVVWLPERERPSVFFRLTQAASSLADTDRVSCMTLLADQIVGLPPATWAPALLALVNMARDVPTGPRQRLLQTWSPLPGESMARFEACMREDASPAASADAARALAAARDALARLTEQTATEVARIDRTQTRA